MVNFYQNQTERKIVMKLRAPAVPLITVDPYFSVWSSDTTLNVSNTEHWTGKSNSIIGTVIVDGSRYLFLGYHRDYHKINQVSLDIDALSTTAVFENEQIRLKAVFTSPVIADDYRLLTRPVTYLEVSYEILDGKEHTVSVNIAASEELCLDEGGQNDVVTEAVEYGRVKGMRMGNTEQKPLNRSGDDVRIDWGYFYLMTDKADAEISANKIWDDVHINIASQLAPSEKLMYYFAYDDIESIEYFGKYLRSYWNKDGQTILEAVDEAAGEYDEVTGRCKAFSEKLYSDALEAGGEKYAELLSLAYRQVIAAHKLVLDENGEILYISKECFSNGCAATVDVSYPSIPMFLLYNPELVKGMMRPVIRYAKSDAWVFDFAPHDVGQYPLVNGQVYGQNALKYQMPVEECGNMLIMDANVAIATGSADFAAEHLDLLEGWCTYLIKYGADPEDQLCTDDFAGHLAHNCNLSLKAVMGLQGMAIITDMLGDADKSAFYRNEAEKMAANWMNTALNPDGTSNLAFDRPYTYSMKYNMVWDKVWKTGLFTQEFMDAEIADNKKHFNKYGMPLDSRADYTKSDWLVWTASMASEKKDFEEYIAPLWKAYDESVSRVPMTDWYDTVSGRWVSFRHRTVQGGLFMRLLMK
ncbi:MAG: DUF4965 domain-containing protein [Acutalibacteraceae bacterium]|nr:DUF4965 domain-containing protein [Acutalibacteraceae bacterium]